MTTWRLRELAQLVTVDAKIKAFTAELKAPAARHARLSGPSQCRPGRAYDAGSNQRRSRRLDLPMLIHRHPPTTAPGPRRTAPPSQRDLTKTHNGLGSDVGPQWAEVRGLVGAHAAGTNR